MSRRFLFVNSGYPRAPLQNGVGRYVCQLQRVTLKFCKNWASSSGVREFIERDLVDFSRQNPGVVVYVKPRRHRNPNLTAEYLNGERKIIHCIHYTREEIVKWMSLLRTQAGREELRYHKLWQTIHPSIQGPWNPLVNRDPQLNLVTFPNEEFSKPFYMPKSATQQLLELFQNQQVDASQERKEAT